MTLFLIIITATSFNAQDSEVVETLEVTITAFV